MSHTEKVSLNNRQLQIQINNDADLSVYREIFLDRDYQMLADLIKCASAPILDIGSHIGLFSLYAHALNATVPIYSFEPDETNFKAIKDHLKLNHVQNVFPKNVAVAGASGQREIHLSEDSHNHSFFDTRQDSGDEPNNLVTPSFPAQSKTRKVQALSLSDIFDSNKAKFSIEKYALIKMDCEGAEFEILQSLSPEELSLSAAYYIEYHEFTTELHATDLVRILQRAGFKTTSTPSRYDARMGFIFARK